MVSTGLAVSRVSVSYPGNGRRALAQPVLSDVTIAVAEREVVALLGPSGCGKSTLLRAIAGLEPVVSGSVQWNGENLLGVPPHARGFGMVFQDAQLFPQMSVAANIAYGLRGAAWPKASRKPRVQELLELVGLVGAEERAVTQLSGGERQRVALARSLAPQPRLLMLDEPLSALDRSLRDRLAIDLANVLRATGTTALLVTHDESEAETIADRTLRMDAGRIVAS